MNATRISILAETSSTSTALSAVLSSSSTSCPEASPGGHGGRPRWQPPLAPQGEAAALQSTRRSGGRCMGGLSPATAHPRFPAAAHPAALDLRRTSFGAPTETACHYYTHIHAEQVNVLTRRRRETCNHGPTSHHACASPSGR
ncbi:hypothetical protein MTO96_002621 [Rhipicephalus appendiculatus]